MEFLLSGYCMPRWYASWVWLDLFFCGVFSPFYCGGFWNLFTLSIFGYAGIFFVGAVICSSWTGRKWGRVLCGGWRNHSNTFGRRQIHYYCWYLSGFGSFSWQKGSFCICHLLSHSNVFCSWCPLECHISTSYYDNNKFKNPIGFPVRVIVY